MARKHLRAWVWSALCAGLAFGCESARPKLSFPQDPLLSSKQPVERKPEEANKVMLALAEPLAPAAPEVVLADRPTGPVRDFQAAPVPPRTPVPVSPVATPRSPVPAQPAVRSEPPGK